MAARSNLRDESGAVAIFAVTLSLAVLMVAGLVYDGGRILAARRQAHAVAANAARAGAQAVDVAHLRGGAVRLDETAAREHALDYLHRVGHTGTVQVTQTEVRVEATADVALAVLRLPGLDTRTVTGRGTAQIVRGVTDTGG